MNHGWHTKNDTNELIHKIDSQTEKHTITKGEKDGGGVRSLRLTYTHYYI